MRRKIKGAKAEKTTEREASIQFHQRRAYRYPPMNPPDGKRNSALFDIKVAILGPVSSGKTTVLNALLGNDYGLVETSRVAPSSGDVIPDLDRTTTEVTYYRLCSSSGGVEHSNKSLHSNESLDDSGYYPASNVNSHYISIQEDQRQLEEQRYHNQALLEATTREYQPGNVREQHVDVSVDQNLFAMRDDTQLVLVDIPGIDCNSTENSDIECPYANYVQNHWDTFDCLLVVLDVTAPPADQEKLLQFVQRNLDQHSTRLPVVCLWNKLDDPYDPKGLSVIQQTQEMVQAMMMQSRTAADQDEELRKQKAELASRSQDNTATTPFRLEVLLGGNRTEDSSFGPPMNTAEGTQESKESDDTTSPKPEAIIKDPSINTSVAESALANDVNETKSPLLFLPVSAKEALVFKRVTNMTLEEFEQWMQQDWMVERLGRDQIGLRRWNRLSRQEQVAESYEMLKDPTEYVRALESCGYAAVERTLGDLVGNVEGSQTTMLETRMELSLRALLDRPSISSTQTSTLLAPQMHSVYTKFQVLYGNTKAAQYLPQELQTAFWAAYDAMEVEALGKVVELGPTYVSALAEPLEQLTSYHKISRLLQWQDSRYVVARRMRSFVLQFLQLLLEQEKLYDYDAWCDRFQSIHNRGDKENTEPQGSKGPWAHLSPKDWLHIWGSILLLAYDRHFCQQFGREKLLVEELLEKARASWKTCIKLILRICPHCSAPLHPVQNEWRCEPCKFAFFTCYPSTQCNSCTHKFDFVGHPEVPHTCEGNGYTYSTQQELQSWMGTFYNRSQELVPNHPSLYRQVVVIGDIPESLADPRHVGHPFYQFCNLKELLEYEAR